MPTAETASIAIDPLAAHLEPLPEHIEVSSVTSDLTLRVFPTEGQSFLAWHCHETGRGLWLTRVKERELARQLIPWHRINLVEVADAPEFADQPF